MTIFLTFNDAPSGIYSSQVIDVVAFLRQSARIQVRLISFISLRGFFRNREAIKEQMRDAIVLPMYPRLKNWEKNQWLLKFICFLLSVDKIIARSALATNLALTVKRKNVKVIYDGRGAIEAEWREYKVVTEPSLLKNIHALEARAVIETAAQLAVSSKLKEFWLSEYAYKSLNTVVSPCTINAVFEKLSFTEQSVNAARKNLGYSGSDLVFIYSGSVSGWQSFTLLEQFAIPLLSKDANVKFLFLSGLDKNIKSIQDRFPNQVMVRKCSPLEVPAQLLVGDYGLLIREESITNKVASPVKFGEYLACGLQVLISEQTGDYSEFVRQNGCGHLLNQSQKLDIPNWEQRLRNRNLALKCFTKTEFLASYKLLLR